MTQLSNVLITLSVIKTSDNCVFSKADLRAINILFIGMFSTIKVLRICLYLCKNSFTDPIKQIKANQIGIVFHFFQA